MNVKFIKDSIYAEGFWLITNCRGEDVSRWIKRKYKFDYDVPKIANGQNITLENMKENKCEHIVWICEFKWRVHEMSLLVHEVFHYVMGVLKDAGVELCEHNEAHAYHLQNMVQKAFGYLADIYRKKGKKK